MNSMALKNQKPTVDTQKLERKGHKYTTKENRHYAYKYTEE